MMKVFIHTDFYSFNTGILFVEERNGKRYVAQPVELIFKEQNEGDVVNPTIRLSETIAHDFLKALAEALDNKDIKTDNDFKIKGLLEATKYHLEDMRNIVFNKTPPTPKED